MIMRVNRWLKTGPLSHHGEKVKLLQNVLLTHPPVLVRYCGTRFTVFIQFWVALIYPKHLYICIYTYTHTSVELDLQRKKYCWSLNDHFLSSIWAPRIPQNSIRGCLFSSAECCLWSFYGRGFCVRMLWISGCKKQVNGRVFRKRFHSAPGIGEEQAGWRKTEKEFSHPFSDLSIPAHLLSFNENSAGKWKRVWREMGASIGEVKRCTWWSREWWMGRRDDTLDKSSSGTGWELCCVLLAQLLMVYLFFSFLFTCFLLTLILT